MTSKRTVEHLVDLLTKVSYVGSCMMAEVFECRNGREPTEAEFKGLMRQAMNLMIEESNVEIETLLHDITSDEEAKRLLYNIMRESIETLPVTILDDVSPN